MTTLFKQIANNAVATSTTSYASTGVTSTTVATGLGALFPTPGNGYYLTIWNGGRPGNDANMEIVTVTARSGDVLTHSATTKTHVAPVTVGVLDVAQNIIDLQTAVNTLEASSGGGSSTPRLTYHSALSDEVFGSYPFVQKVLGTGSTAVWNNPGVNMQCGTALNDYAALSTNGYLFGNQFEAFGRNYTAFWQSYSFASNSNANLRMCVGNDVYTNGNTYSGNAVGFMWDYSTGTLYGYAYNGTATRVSLTTTATLTPNQQNLFAVNVKGTTTADFYVNGALLGSVTSNIPTSGFQGSLSMGLANGSTHASPQAVCFEMGMSVDAF